MSDDNFLDVFVNTAQEWAILAIMALLVAVVLVIVAPIFVSIAVVYAIQGKFREENSL